MSFPTPNDSFIKEFKENFNLLEQDFLEPKKLQVHLRNIERLIERDYHIMASEDANSALSHEQKQTIKDLLEKIESKRKESEEKTNWSNDFSGFLQDQNITK